MTHTHIHYTSIDSYVDYFIYASNIDTYPLILIQTIHHHTIDRQERKKNIQRSKTQAADQNPSNASSLQCTHKMRLARLWHTAHIARQNKNQWPTRGNCELNAPSILKYQSNAPCTKTHSNTHTDGESNQTQTQEDTVGIKTTTATTAKSELNE